MANFLSLHKHSSDGVMGLYPDGRHVSWGQFYDDVQAVADQVSAQHIVLACRDIYYFMVSFLALTHNNTDISLPPNLQRKTVQDIIELTNAEILDDSIIEDILKTPVSNAHVAPSPPSAPKSIITLYTSGSSGAPTAIKRALFAFESELRMFHERWGDRIKGGVFATSASYYHAYGLPFYVLWALDAGEPVALQQIGYPEELMLYAQDRHINFIAAPAFFKRHRDFFGQGRANQETLSHLKFVTSAGSSLSHDMANTLADALLSPVIEIYGSTETGAIASRGVGHAHWQCLDGVVVTCDDNGHVCVASPVIGQQDNVTLRDQIEVFDNGHFTLKGRSDRIIKIFEKRISLDELEARCGTHEWVEAVCMSVLTSSNRLGAAVVLTECGKAALKHVGRREFTNVLRRYLSENFDLVTLPRKWRFVDNLPVNEMGKIHNILLQALFDGK